MAGLCRVEGETRTGYVGTVGLDKEGHSLGGGGDAHRLGARMALQARDCKVVTTEHGAGAIGNRLQHASLSAGLCRPCVPVCAIPPLSVPVPLSPPVSLALPFLRLVNRCLVLVNVARPIDGRVRALTPPPVAPSFTVRVPAYLAGTKYLTALLPVPLTRVRARN